MTPRNTPTGARLAGSSGSVSGEDVHIPRKGVGLRPKDCIEMCNPFLFQDYVSKMLIDLVC